MKPSEMDMNHEIKNDKLLKQRVIQSAESIKKKLKLIRDAKTNGNIMLQTILKPITEPLNEMVKIGNNNDNLNKSETDLGNDGFKWNRSVKRLKYGPSDDEKQESSINKTALRDIDLFEDGKKECSGSNDTEDESNDSNISEEQQCFNQSDLSDNASFRTSESFASPRDDPQWQKKYSNINIPFGLRTERGKLMLGSKTTYLNDEELVICGEKYSLTPGLHELLFKKLPDLNEITEYDRQLYKTLLLKTNAHRRDFDPNKPIKSNKGMKYLRIIKPLFKLTKQRTVSDEIFKYGTGLPTMKKVKKDVSYVFWDDPNELVERLKLLIASRDAGNTGLDNEIISIIEELQEAGLVNNI